MRKDFQTEASDACLAATGEIAAEMLKCSLEDVVFARAINNQKIGFCWAKIKDKKVEKYQPSFKNNIFGQNDDLSKIKLKVISKDFYFVKDGRFYHYMGAEKTIYHVRAIDCGQVAAERALLAGIAVREKPQIAIIKNISTGKFVPAWVVKDETNHRQTYFPVFDGDWAKLCDNQGNPLACSQLQVRYLDTGQGFSKYGSFYTVLISAKGYYIE